MSIKYVCQINKCKSSESRSKTNQNQIIWNCQESFQRSKWSIFVVEDNVWPIIIAIPLSKCSYIFSRLLKNFSEKYTIYGPPCKWTLGWRGSSVQSRKTFPVFSDWNFPFSSLITTVRHLDWKSKWMRPIKHAKCKYKLGLELFHRSVSIFLLQTL